MKCSDDIRSSKPLAHAKSVDVGPVELEHGGRLDSVTVAFETWGSLNKEASNAVVVCHALSGDSHAAKHSENDDPGWWDSLVGPGRAVDTNAFFVVCANCLGGCRGTTGPASTNPATGRPYGSAFPEVTMGDIVETQRRLVLGHLGVKRIASIIGGSMGGMQAMIWATRHAEFVESAVLLASCARLSTQSLAFDVVGRNAIFGDSRFNRGDFYGSAPPDVGLSIARQLAHITYLSPASMESKFGPDRHSPRPVVSKTPCELRFSVGSYLAHQGTKFVERFDPNTYISISRAIDTFDMGATPEELARSLSASVCRWLVVSFTSDWLFPPSDSQAIVNALLSSERRVSYASVTSKCGHDAFLLEDDLASYGTLVSQFLCPMPPRQDRGPLFGKLLNAIPSWSPSVLDVGCSFGGSLLASARTRPGTRVLGIAESVEQVISCCSLGVDAVHVNSVCEGLARIADTAWDVAILSESLSFIDEASAVIVHLARIARQAIIFFHNATYRGNATTIFFGEAPVFGESSWQLGGRRSHLIGEGEFEKFVTSCGLKVDKLTAVNTFSWNEVPEASHGELIIATISNCGRKRPLEPISEGLAQNAQECDRDDFTFFGEDCPDLCVLEIASWLIAGSKPPNIRQLRDLAYFGQTCKRIHVLSASPSLWRCVDAGRILSKAGFWDEADSLESAERMVTQLLRLPQIAACETLSPFTAPADVWWALQLSMPNLRNILVVAPPSAKSVRRRLPRARRATCPKSLSELQLASVIESFRSLEGADLRVPVAKLPATLRCLRIEFASSYSSKIPTVIRNCPLGVTSFSFVGVISQSNCDAILKLETKFEEISFDGDGPDEGQISLRGLTSAPCAKYLRQLTFVKRTLEADSFQIISQYCPNLESLAISGVWATPSDVRSLASLRHLRRIAILSNATSDNAEMANAFAALGSSEGATFTEITTTIVTFDLTDFFAGKRCQGIEKVCLSGHFGKTLGSVIARGCHDSLTSLELITPSSLKGMGPILSRCHRLSHFVLSHASDNLLLQLPSSSVAPLTKVHIYFPNDVDTATPEALRALSNVLRTTESLFIDMEHLDIPSDLVVEFLASCPSLKKVRGNVPPNILGLQSTSGIDIKFDIDPDELEPI